MNFRQPSCCLQRVFLSSKNFLTRESFMIIIIIIIINIMMNPGYGSSIFLIEAAMNAALNISHKQLHRATET